MSFVNDLLSRLFPEESVPDVVESDGLLSQRQQREYAKWIQGSRPTVLCDLFIESFRRKSLGLDGPLTLFNHKSNGASGFYFLLKAPLKEREALWIQEWIGERIVSQCGYRRVHSSFRSRVQSDKIEDTRLLYFKPPIPSGEGPFDQKYGNLHLEFFSRENKPVWIKLMGFYYSDSMYREPLPFDAISEVLFSKS
jgi:hypothetical protein